MEKIVKEKILLSMSEVDNIVSKIEGVTNFNFTKELNTNIGGEECKIKLSIYRENFTKNANLEIIIMFCNDEAKTIIYKETYEKNKKNEFIGVKKNGFIGVKKINIEPIFNKTVLLVNITLDRYRGRA